MTLSQPAPAASSNLAVDALTGAQAELVQHFDPRTVSRRVVRHRRKRPHHLRLDRVQAGRHMLVLVTMVPIAVVDVRAEVTGFVRMA